MNFIKYLLFTFLFLVSTHLLARDTKTVTFKAFGFSIEKPKSWHDSSSEDFTENLNRVKSSDEEFDALLKKYTQVPFFSILKYKNPYDDINPSLKINVAPKAVVDPEKPELYLESIAKTMKSNFANFKLLSKPVLTKLDGHKSAFIKYSYKLSVEGSTSYDITSAIWIVTHKRQSFIIGAGFRSDEANGGFAELEKIVVSIKFL
ncbi:hypothetical protein LPTSP4_35920 [Leptospira ryugenii]|uniref:Lipid/polyisoprenoid-binding YceI-like domain-containing protein n=1 Tax=Leptospira ryugenii TaxID=1917863 RepID=A0A2P2E5C6_9LEPT|nr:hypothetical protein [Leptospira ryugenii]GBF52054.1 hypothetical protein LPTSP4_35920 [Leptospira ryugenii]